MRILEDLRPVAAKAAAAATAEKQAEIQVKLVRKSAMRGSYHKLTQPAVAVRSDDAGATRAMRLHAAKRRDIYGYENVSRISLSRYGQSTTPTLR